MKLSQLLEKADVESAYADVEISFVTDRPENCKRGCAFVCIEGKSFDGHRFIENAKAKGAAVFITQKDTEEKNQVIVKNTRKAYAYMCSKLFGEPSKAVKLIGVTGTNGKTSTAGMIYSLLTLFGEKAGLMGTVENIIDGKKEKSEYTTPDAFEFNRTLRKMADCGTKYCVCEVSSQALSQYRVYTSEFFVGVFTNITVDHLDYHGSFENYLGAKKKLFENCKNAVINIDDEHAPDITDGFKGNIMTFSVSKNEADITAKDIRYFPDHSEYAAVMISHIGRVKVSSIGEFSVKNSLAALAVMLMLGFDFNEVCEKMHLVKPVRGRCEILPTDTPYKVIIDYAHTPDALYNIIGALNVQRKGRLIVLFGCGGNRDKGKRADMGRVVTAFADIAVITDDNPRNENEDEIISDILSGTDGRKCRIYVEKDRYKAIKLALDKAQKDDIVLLAGKGHEAYQITENKMTPFDEREKVAEILG